MNHVTGYYRGNILLYALSTCVWCKKTKKLLNDLGVEYDYIDVDLLDREEKERVKQEISRWNPACSFPTLVINDEKYIINYDRDKIIEELGES